MSQHTPTQRKNKAGLALGLLAVCILPLGCQANQAGNEEGTPLYIQPVGPQ